MTTHQHTIPAPREVPEDPAPLSFGVEEEFFVVDTGDGTAFGCNHDVVAAASTFGVDLDVELCPATIDETVLPATLVRALVATALRAVRAGLEDTWLDVHSGHLVPPRQVLRSLIRHLRPELTGRGDHRRTGRGHPVDAPGHRPGVALTVARVAPGAPETGEPGRGKCAPPG
jgi:hypothetical protein